jgi:arsenite methyltransferase
MEFRMTQEIAKPDYGIDAPGLVLFFFASGLTATILYFLISVIFVSYPVWIFPAHVITGVAATYLTGMGCLMLYWSKTVKVRERESVLDQISWRGDERVLDVGCGRGLMLIGAARRLTTGRAMGIDIWQAKDQSANTPEGALNNAHIEGVLEKIKIQTADMRSLPFADHSFDVVVSHWVVHNLESKTDRDLSLSEMARVLQPGGSLILCDIENRDAYLERLNTFGLTNLIVKFNPIADTVLGIISIGSFRPTAIIARKPT